MKRIWILASMLPTTSKAVDGAAASASRSIPSVGWLQWGLALLLVLDALLAFLCLMRRLGGTAGLGLRHHRVIGGVSLGVRERVVLLQAGNKQLLLGVSPGRIQTLCVLEGDDKVPMDAPADPAAGDGVFARQLNSLLAPKESAS